MKNATGGEHVSKNDTNLTKKEEKFVDEYLKDFNGKRAYMTAFGIKNEHSARTLASRLLAKADIQAELEKRRKEMRTQYSNLRERMIERNVNILFQDFTNIASVQTKVVQGLTIQSVIITDMDQLTEEQRQCVKSIKQTRDGISVEFESKEKAEDTLIKLLGYDKEQEQGQYFDPSILKGLTKEEILKIAFEDEVEDDEE